MELNSTEPQLEYNRKWKCYVFICVTSLTNFVSVGETFDIDIPQGYFGKNPRVNYMFGIVTFTASLLILILDLIGFIRNKFDFKSLKDGKVEGWTLFAFFLWWVCGVISLTKAGALGYASLNIYLSSWASLFSCLDALNKWGGEKDILTMHQLTRISITLPSWWILFWASIIILGSAADGMSLATTDYVINSCGVAVGVSAITIFVSAFFILSHYEFFQCGVCTSWLTYGGWCELACSILANIWLLIGLEQLTGAGAIASTVTGSGGFDRESEDYVPGTNIHLSIWTAFIASLSVTIKWKEARAIRFAQTSGGKAGEDEEEGQDEEGHDEEVENGNNDSVESGI
mmetsp:Transcript_1518/g.3229  ORF Transcript_1518/g.3229 Transcript_1518/m.3229 type:complete len:344 (+) Transcript_1518:215-1246(+)|eukprot:CAMPEP_0172322002 /NCGR_PEP_ID=MMETSP1058-20130122/44762_1 /TAXON_ID=83371 /ORGANISM="Detonula confervacea, Strain CCMP 353" /LENGTH=343 /DNA_ID=CAMNT_0013037633 /DNA_START=142 /DNA_END=1173 /DNA_ORIENTATION=+